MKHHFALDPLGRAAIVAALGLLLVAMLRGLL